jgi:hypothetical protein
LLDDIGFFEDLVIPEANDADALLGQKVCTARVVCNVGGIGVLAAVGFDGEVLVVAKEINDVVPDRGLAAEFEAGQATVAKNAPEAFLGVGGEGAHGARELEEVIGGWRFVDGLFGHWSLLSFALTPTLSRRERG